MRVVWGPSELADAVDGARREAEAAFGDGAVFLERYLREPRHIEVQVLADAYGDTVALFERECSIQRRHQKIVEEAPSPVVTPELRHRLTGAAVAAARQVGYVNAGTVEFLVDAEGEPYFLEMNTRLQVEHPVTEAICGLDLVRLQLLIAGGAPMPPEVAAAVAAGPRGHAIEARLYAEDPSLGWLPSAGTLHRFEYTDRQGAIAIRVDSGVESGSVVSPHYDPMLAKFIAHAPSRAEAATALAASLTTTRIHGLTTNRDLLVRVIKHPGFLAGKTDTGFLDRHGVDRLASPLADLDAVRRHALAAALAEQARRRRGARVQPTVPSGYRNNASGLQQDTYRGRGTIGGGGLPVRSLRAPARRGADRRDQPGCRQGGGDRRSGEPHRRWTDPSLPRSNRSDPSPTWTVPTEVPRCTSNPGFLRAATRLPRAPRSPPCPVAWSGWPWRSATRWHRVSCWWCSRR